MLLTMTAQHHNSQQLTIHIHIVIGFTYHKCQKLYATASFAHSRLKIPSRIYISSNCSLYRPENAHDCVRAPID